MANHVRTFFTDSRTEQTLRALLALAISGAIRFYAPFPVNSSTNILICFLAFAYFFISSVGMANVVAQTFFWGFMAGLFILTFTLVLVQRHGEYTAYIIIMLCLLALEPVLHGQSFSCRFFIVILILTIDAYLFTIMDIIPQLTNQNMYWFLWNSQDGIFFKVAMSSFLLILYILIPSLIPPRHWASSHLFTVTSKLFQDLSVIYVEFAKLIIDDSDVFKKQDSQKLILANSTQWKQQDIGDSQIESQVDHNFNLFKQIHTSSSKHDANAFELLVDKNAPDNTGLQTKSKSFLPLFKHQSQKSDSIDYSNVFEPAYDTDASESPGLEPESSSINSYLTRHSTFFTSLLDKNTRKSRDKNAKLFPPSTCELIKSAQSLCSTINTIAMDSQAETILWPLGSSQIPVSLWIQLQSHLIDLILTFETTNSLIRHSTARGTTLKPEYAVPVVECLRTMSSFFDCLAQDFRSSRYGSLIFLHGTSKLNASKDIVDKKLERVRLIKVDQLAVQIQQSVDEDAAELARHIESLLAVTKEKGVTLDSYLLSLLKEADANVYNQQTKSLFHLRNDSVLVSFAMITGRVVRDNFRQDLVNIMSWRTRTTFKGFCRNWLSFFGATLKSIAEQYALVPARIKSSIKDGPFTIYFFYAFRCYLGLAFLYALMIFIPEYRRLMSAHFGPWQVHGFMLTLDSSLEGTVKKGILRIIGSCLGGAVGFIITMIAREVIDYTTFLYVIILIFLSIIIWICPVPKSSYNIPSELKYLYQSTGITFAVIALGGYDIIQEENTIRSIGIFAASRVVAQLIAVSAAIGVSMFIAPTFAYREARKSLDNALLQGLEALRKTSRLYFRVKPDCEACKATYSMIPVGKAEIELRQEVVRSDALVKGCFRNIDLCRSYLAQADKYGRYFVLFPKFMRSDDTVYTLADTVQRFIHVIRLYLRVIELLKSETFGPVFLSSSPFGDEGLPLFHYPCDPELGQLGNSFNQMLYEIVELHCDRMQVLGAMINTRGPTADMLCKLRSRLKSARLKAIEQRKVTEEKAQKAQQLVFLSFAKYLSMWMKVLGVDNVKEDNCASFRESLGKTASVSDIKRVHFLYMILTKMGTRISEELELQYTEEEGVRNL